MKTGFIMLNRNIVNNWLFKKPLYFHWFIHLLVKANFKTNDKFLFNGRFLLVKRGELVTSVRILAKELPESSEQKVKTFLKLLESSGTIDKKSIQGATQITICNYDSYQSVQPANNPQTTQEQPASNQGATTIEEGKESNKENKDNNDYRKSLLSELNNSDVPNQEHLEITLAFHDLFKSNQTALGIPTTTLDKASGKWIDSIRLMMESDKRTKEQLLEVFEFLKTDLFWSKNILSTSKLREKFEQLLTNSRSNKNGKAKSSARKGASYEEIGNILSEEFGHLPN